MRLLALVAALSVAGAATAQDAGSAKSRDYVAAAAGSDTFEMMEASSALAESRDPQVRAFAQRMLQDHARTGADLAQAATSAGLKPPVMAIGAAQSPLLASLQSARGADFDRLYWKQQALAHRSALITEQDYVRTGDAPALRQAAQAAIPIIQAHLGMAERMAAQAGG